ncbi:MAG: SMC-Scp complex subunit ScpB [Nanoarchaeota archaeon]|nr:SMC-Scp complex subunit ScpB [Nanoarchaeota archaeon]
MDDMQNRVEAVLFITGSFMSIEDIGKSAGIASEDIVREAVQRLRKAYDENQGSLEIIKNEGRYKIALRKDYVPLSTKLLSTTELDRPTQETLAIIAYKQPIIQADLIKIRGNGAYDHVHTLKDHQFITSEKFGRTRKLRLAPKFFDYFDIAGDQLKSKCDEVGHKVGTVERFEKKDDKDQASLEGYKQEEKEPEPTEPDPKPIPPDPEPIDPEEPDVKDPRKKPQEPEEEPAEEVQ